jgi:hypothetical protein
MPMHEHRHREDGSVETPDAPEGLLGLWVRESITLGDGTVDRATKVWWGQTRRAFVDLRIPEGRPNLSRTMDEFLLPPSILESLGRQKGFAGHILIEGARCRWIRSIDFQPRSGRPDEAVIRIEGDVLYEDGKPGSVVGAAYREVYRRVRRADRRCISLRLAERESPEHERREASHAILVIVDETFMFAKRRPQQLVGTDMLSDLLVKATSLKEVKAYLDCEISLGVIGRTGEGWTIQHSTLPWREGQPLGIRGKATLASDRLVIQEPSGKEVWSIEESNLPRKELVELFDKLQ